jgi:sugar lactone lactonase YvrE
MKLRTSFFNFAHSVLLVAQTLVIVTVGAAGAELRITSLSSDGDLSIADAFTNGICTIEGKDNLDGAWQPLHNLFTTSTLAQTSLSLTGLSGFHRVAALDLRGGRAGFTNLTRAYGLLSTVAGAGGFQDFNNWRPEFEGAPASTVLLSGPHMTMGDRAGNLYIADKDSHGIRKVRPDGILVTVAGINAPGNGPDEPAPGTQVGLIEPNGIWVEPDGTLYILDVGNGKVRKLDTNGIMRTLFTVPGGISVGRGLWVKPDESEVYLCSLSVVKRWTPDTGVADFSTDYLQLGNLVVDAGGQVVVTDRSAHRVYRLDAQGNRTVIAGNGLTSGGGDGQLATQTALEEVRGVWCMPNGGFLLATHRSSRVWYVDPEGYIHLLLNGNRNGAHFGDGTWFYNPLEARVSECRAVTLDYEGNIIITENDIGYIRKVRFLPFQP